MSGDFVADAREPIAVALNRVADALFQQSKALKRSSDAATRSVELSAEMVEMQKAAQAVTKQLEQALAAQALAAAEAEEAATIAKYGPRTRGAGDGRPV